MAQFLLHFISAYWHQMTIGLTVSTAGSLFIEGVRTWISNLFSSMLSWMFKHLPFRIVWGHKTKTVHQMRKNIEHATQTGDLATFLAKESSTIHQKLDQCDEERRTCLESDKRNTAKISSLEVKIGDNSTKLAQVVSLYHESTREAGDLAMQLEKCKKAKAV